MTGVESPKNREKGERWCANEQAAAREVEFRVLGPEQTCFWRTLFSTSCF